MNVYDIGQLFGKATDLRVEVPLPMRLQLRRCNPMPLKIVSMLNLPSPREMQSCD